MIFAGSDDHADAVIFAALIFTEKSELASIEEIGVRVEHTKHAGDGAFVDGFIGVHGIGVVGLDDVEDVSEIFDGGLVVVHVGGGGANGRTVDAAKDGGDDKDNDDDDQAATFRIHVCPHR